MVEELANRGGQGARADDEGDRGLREWRTAADGRTRLCPCRCTGAGGCTGKGCAAVGEAGEPRRV